MHLNILCHRSLGFFADGNLENLGRESGFVHFNEQIARFHGDKDWFLVVAIDHAWHEAFSTCCAGCPLAGPIASLNCQGAYVCHF